MTDIRHIFYIVMWGVENTETKLEAMWGVENTENKLEAQVNLFF